MIAPAAGARGGEPVAVLTIAGSDPSGAAGIAQDLATFHALGVFGMVAVSAVTVQTPARVSWESVAPAVLAEQIAAAFGSMDVAAVKTGMLPTAAHVRAVSAALAGSRAPLVLDPVLATSSGFPLADEDVPAALAEHLLPLATLVTPNTEEAGRLAGIDVASVAEMTEAAARLRAAGAGAALVTGGHLDGATITDVLADEAGVRQYDAPRLGPGARGTGCVLSAAIAAALATGEDLRAGVTRARAIVRQGLEQALRTRAGSGVTNPAGLRHF
ncbi:MAG TPA: bifunctional hydroxymethylpyrimidine kinase/phosphomethylpyrimidine kinase [Actinomycetota bacterium]